MYGIGTVARLAQVSPRTLRHYDEIGLLRPAHVDPATGYRHYSAAQLHRLHRILVLRDLGVPLAEIGALLEEDVSLEQLRGILLLRRAEARARLATQAAQLTRVETRLAQLEEDPVTSHEVIVKRLDPVRLAALTEDLTGHDRIADAAGRLYPRLHAALADRGVAHSGLSFALYDESGDEQHPVRFTAALPVPDGVTVEGDGIATLDLPAVDRAATTVVRGAPEGFPAAFEALFAWVERTGHRTLCHEREVYIDCDGPPDTWVTELQATLAP